ncbi:hypothetical protein D3C72_1065270 [compost metagenome]
MPETQRSGFLFKTSFTANFTQSTGVPEHEYSISTSFPTVILLRYKVLLMVMAWPVADWGLSGATTTTSPISFITLIKVRIPGAEIPSSLVTKIKGFFPILKFLPDCLS